MENPKENIAALLSFLNLEFDENLIEKAIGQHIPKNKNHGKWKNELNQNELEIFMKRSGKLIDDLGYN